METIRGRRSLDLDLNGLLDRLTHYQRVFLDLGTGDGRYVRFLAEKNPDSFVIGVDACRENLHEHSRSKLPNALFVVARAQELPHELHGLASRITINFPWGSLLKSLLDHDESLLHGLSCIARADAHIEVCLNRGALAEAGANFEEGTQRVHENIERYGWQLSYPCLLDAHALKDLPTTWAKRLAHGRDPHAVHFSGRRIL